MKTITLQLETLTCPSCAGKIESAVKRVDGVEKVEVLFTSSRVRVSFDELKAETAKIQKTVEGLGFDVLSIK